MHPCPPLAGVLEACVRMLRRCQPAPSLASSHPSWLCMRRRRSRKRGGLYQHVVRMFQHLQHQSALRQADVRHTEHELPDQWLGERLPDVIGHRLDWRTLVTKILQRHVKEPCQDGHPLQRYIADSPLSQERQRGNGQACSLADLGQRLWTSVRARCLTQMGEQCDHLK